MSTTSTISAGSHAGFGVSTATSSPVSKAPTPTQAASDTGSTALGKLTSNYSTFLKLLMTQLQNQDPSSPMDTNQFTTELVQFSSVEQQINTNSSLTQLIQLTQSGALLQSSALVGHSVAVSNSDMPVQNGTGKIQFTAPASGSVSVSVYDSTGRHMGDSLVQPTKGINEWSWKASDSNGKTQPDGPYKIVVRGIDTSGAISNLPFTAIGLATGVTKNGTTLQLQLGKMATDFSNVQAVLN
jgi:flagellar basal-body rod modification protein FlgD